MSPFTRTMDYRKYPARYLWPRGEQKSKLKGYAQHLLPNGLFRQYFN